MWIFGNLFSKKPTILYTVDDEPPKRSSRKRDKKANEKKVQTYEEYLQKKGGPDAIDRKSTEMIEEIMRQGPT